MLYTFSVLHYSDFLNQYTKSATKYDSHLALSLAVTTLVGSLSSPIFYDYAYYNFGLWIPGKYGVVSLCVYL